MAGLAIAGAIEGASPAALPKDPCALLKPAEIQSALAAKATIGAGVSDTAMLPVGIGCTYTWGPRTSGWGETSLTLTVIDASKAWVGVSAADLERGILMKARPGQANASVIPGVGDAAVFTYEARSHNASAEAYYKSKNLHLTVTFHEGSSLQDKDKIVALLKKAAARL
jgi:hypothetical protein